MFKLFSNRTRPTVCSGLCGLMLYKEYNIGCLIVYRRAGTEVSAALS